MQDQLGEKRGDKKEFAFVTSFFKDEQCSGL